MRLYRKEKLARRIREVVSDVLLRRLHDPRLSAMTTVTRVKVSGDLQIAKVYVSVLGGETEERKTLAALAHATSHVQHLVALELTVRHAPQLRFELDQGMIVARETLRLIEENQADRPQPEQDDGGDMDGPSVADDEIAEPHDDGTALDAPRGLDS